MSNTDVSLTDVSDMYSVHEAFRRGLRDARSQITAAEGNAEHARRFSDYFAELLFLLHAHHGGEDELLYPLLVERAADERDLFLTMDAQHRGVEESLEACVAANAAFGESATASDGVLLADACDELAATLTPHLDEEEVTILPIAAKFVSPEEWGMLPGHAMLSYQGERIWLPFGLATEAMSADTLVEVTSHLPPPLQDMWFGFGADAFSTLMIEIRTTS
jgi:hemerythrin-like domain-containing protein